ncbi:unnamed protein product [Polarella glacialis]|uniref:Uncharacterized protein n=1 Tax=Polarella glacialis TaxID=89957 RepID=A0A813GIE0_POLGL|nr:unnamed protein product [Polarella glacialis]
MTYQQRSNGRAGMGEFASLNGSAASAPHSAPSTPSLCWRMVIFDIEPWGIGQVQQQEQPDQHHQQEGLPREEKKEAEKEGDVATTGEVDGKVENEEKKKNTKRVNEVSYEWKLLDKNKPLRIRKFEGVIYEEYLAFYELLSNNWEDFLAAKHYSVEGLMVFGALLFVPRHTSFDPFESEKINSNIKKYVCRAFKETSDKDHDKAAKQETCCDG